MRRRGLRREYEVDGRGLFSGELADVDGERLPGVLPHALCAHSQFAALFGEAGEGAIGVGSGRPELPACLLGA